MRPVERGHAPRVYADYPDAQTDLVAKIGDYCSYCERQIETHLAVEHVQPKSRRKALRNDWGNFLLGCVNCNSSKGKKAVTLTACLWPDRDNTARAYDYTNAGEVHVSRGFRRLNRTRAQATLELVGLDKVPGHANARRRPTASDIRWRRRQEAFALAERQLRDLLVQDTPIVRQLIVDTAVGRGMFSIWMHVFRNDPNMRQRLVAAFRGTASSCYDPVTLAAVRRPGGVM
jgi:uncharacterized protein (TIGR02646 family)